MIRRVLVNNVFLGVQFAAGAAVPLLLVPHIVRSIGLSAYGSFALMLSWAGIASVIVQYAFQLTGPKRIAQSTSGASIAHVFVEISAAKVMLLSGALPVVLIIAFWSLPAGMGWPHAVVLVGLPVSAALNSAWFLLARDRAAPIGIFALLSSAVALWIGFEVVGGPDTRSLWGVAAALITGPLLTGAATLAYSWWLVRNEGLAGYSVRPAYAIREGWPLFGSQFAAALYSSSGPIVINHFAGLGAAGTYGAVERFFNALMAGCLLTHTAAYPRLALTYENDRKSYRFLVKAVVGTYLLVTALISGAAIYFREALSLFLLGEYALQASALIVWASAWLILGIFGPVLTGILTVSGRASAVAPLTVRVLVVSLLLGIPGVMLFGAAGWIASLVIAQAVVLHAAYRCWRTVDAG